MMTRPTLSCRSHATGWGSLRLPLDLGSAGLPGCSLLVSADWFFPVFNWNGTARLALDIPDDASLLGVSFHDQAFVVDRSANPFGAIVSNAGEGRIGSR